MSEVKRLGAPPPGVKHAFIPAPVVPKPSGIAVDWKRRAIEAERMLEHYKTFRKRVDVALLEQDKGLRDDMLDDLFAESVFLEDAKKPRAFFDQVAKVLDANVTLRTTELLPDGILSRFDHEHLLVEISAKANDAQKLIGTVFQLLHVADLAASTEAGLPLAVTPAWLQDRVPAFALLLVATGLLNPEVPVAASDIEAASEALEDEA